MYILPPFLSSIDFLVPHVHLAACNTMLCHLYSSVTSCATAWTRASMMPSYSWGRDAPVLFTSWFTRSTYSSRRYDVQSHMRASLRCTWWIMFVHEMWSLHESGLISWRAAVSSLAKIIGFKFAWLYDVLTAYTLYEMSKLIPPIMSSVV